MIGTHRTDWSISSDVAHVDEEERVVALNLDQPDSSGPRILINEAADIWRAVRTASSEDVIIEQVANIYGISAEAIEGDIRRFLVDMETQGMLVSRAAE